MTTMTTMIAHRNAPRRLAASLGAALLTCALVVAGVAASPTADDDPPKVAAVGKKAPDFTLVDTKGNTRKLSDYAGKIVVLEWTDPECPFVLRHLRTGSMNKTYKKVRQLDKSVVWLAINSTRHTTAEKNTYWLDTYKIPYPLLLDPDGKVGRRFAARRNPQMYVIDKKGVLRYSGAIDDNPLAAKDAAQVKNFVLEAVQALVDGEDVTRSDQNYGCAIKYAR